MPLDIVESIKILDATEASALITMVIANYDGDLEGISTDKETKSLVDVINKVERSLSFVGRNNDEKKYYIKNDLPFDLADLCEAKNQPGIDPKLKATMEELIEKLEELNPAQPPRTSSALYFTRGRLTTEEINTYFAAQQEKFDMDRQQERCSQCRIS